MFKEQIDWLVKQVNKINDAGCGCEDCDGLTCEDLENCKEIIDIKDSIAEGGGGGLTLIERKYSELTTMIANSELDPGQLYKMTDFQTIYDQPDYSDAYTPKSLIATKMVAVDPIILLAISTTEFAKEVWRPSTPKHTLEYDINFNHTAVMGKPAKGRITYCKDEFDNETHYDHTVVLLKRYRRVSGFGNPFNSFWDTGFTSTEVLTFGTGSISNKIGDNYYGLAGSLSGFAVSNNVLGLSSLGNIIGIGSNNNTFGNSTNNNTFGNYTHNNTFGAGTSNNTFGNYTSRNTFKANTRNNTFGNYTQDNTFGDYTQHNTFGNNTDISNTFGDRTQYNSFGNETRNTTFGNDTQNNIFGNKLSYIDFTITPATHIYGTYLCNIFKRQDGTVRLSYYDNTDTLVVVNPTD